MHARRRGDQLAPRRRNVAGRQPLGGARERGRERMEPFRARKTHLQHGARQVAPAGCFGFFARQHHDRSGVTSAALVCGARLLSHSRRASSACPGFFASLLSNRAPTSGPRVNVQDMCFELKAVVACALLFERASRRPSCRACCVSAAFSSQEPSTPPHIHFSRARCSLF